MRKKNFMNSSSSFNRTSSNNRKNFNDNFTSNKFSSDIKGNLSSNINSNQSTNNIFLFNSNHQMNNISKFHYNRSSGLTSGKEDFSSTIPKRMNTELNNLKRISSSESNNKYVENRFSTSEKREVDYSIILSNQKQKEKSTGTIGRMHRGINNSTALRKSNYVDQEYAISIIENYAREVGITAFNLRTMEFFTTQFIDNEAYVNTITMINFWRPLEIVMNQKSENSCLHLLIKKIFKNCYIGFLQRKAFAEDIGRDIYLKSGNKELSLEEINTKYVCMASLSGLVTYLEQNSNLKIEKDFMIIKYHYLENHLNISFQSTIDLELLINSKFNKSCGSLFSLFQCQTVSGLRLLRSNILQPLALKDELNRRYTAIEELGNNPDVLIKIKDYLAYFKDLEIYVSKFMQKIEDPTESTMKQILSSIGGIRTCLKALQNFKEILKGKLKAELFTIVINCFEDKVFSTILENIDTLIDDFDFGNVKITRKQDSIYFMIKSGYSNVLDVSRKTYSDTVNDIYSEYEKLKQTTNDPNIKLLYSEKKGYYVLLGEKYFVESDFVLSKKVGQKYNCTNIALLSLSERVLEIKRDMVEITTNLILDLIAHIRKNINYLFVLSSYIATLDLVCTFSDFSKSTNSVRPIIGTSKKHPYVLGKNCRHPLFEKYLNNTLLTNNNSSTGYVPNDYFFTSHFNILLLKGANASGKTTYMKQLALNTILAQIGCFVPCEYFEFSLRKFLYTKFGSNDSLEENKGSYIKEIIDIQKAISNHLSDSLILLDEPFDNSDSIENLSLSISVLDQFTTKFNNSFVIISSHNNSLTQLGCFYFNIITGSMIVEYTDETLNFLFKFKFINPIFVNEDLNDSIQPVRENNRLDSVLLNREENYGIILAKMIGFDQEIIGKTMKIANASLNRKKKLENYVDKSDHISYVKLFLFNFLRELYELKYVSNTYVIEDQVNMKKIEILKFIRESLN